MQPPHTILIWAAALWCPCRFYFLGDDDLLEVLGQSNNPEVIQGHLKKLFAGIHKVGWVGHRGYEHSQKRCSSAATPSAASFWPLLDAVCMWYAPCVHVNNSTSF